LNAEVEAKDEEQRKIEEKLRKKIKYDNRVEVIQEGNQLAQKTNINEGNKGQHDSS
jgi:hypothetical protein